MSEIDDQIAAAQTAIADAQTSHDGLSTTLAGLSVAIRAAIDAVNVAKLAVDAIEPPAPPAPLTVVDYGADPSGVVDSTSAINTAIAAGHGIIPAGTYKVTAGSDNKAIKLAAGQTLTFDDTDGAVNVNLTPNSKPRYYIIYGNGAGIQVLGKGNLKGDRLSHTYSTDSTHEWGAGVVLNSDNAVLEDIKVSECTGDGVGLIGTGIVVRRIVSTKNRRQAMSTYDVDNLQVYDSEFSLTGALLTDGAAPNGPCAGVDMEPDFAGTASATFTRCKFNGNRAGFLAWLRSEVGGSITVTLNDCEFLGNANGINTKALAGSITGTVTGSSFNNNRGSGLRIESGSSWTVNDNLFDSVTERVDFTKTGTDSRTVNDIRILTGGSATVGTNKYV